MDIVFRIYDNCLASGIEAIFGFSIMLLKKNEDLLLSLKFDEILAFLNMHLFDRYKASEMQPVVSLLLKSMMPTPDRASRRGTRGEDHEI